MASSSVDSVIDKQTKAEGTDYCEEIAQIKLAYAGGCRVITDSGNYKHIVKIQPKDLDVTITFQLRATYPSVIPDIAIRSSSLSQEHSIQLHDVLTTKAKELLGKPMIQHLMTHAQEILQTFGLKPGKARQVDTLTVITDKDKSKSKKDKRKKKRIPKSEDEVEEEKKKPMKTADDVIKRILWDESLESDDFLVGYIDRFRGLLEKYFTAFSWEDLATVDYDVLAVPHHRIQYFKYKTIKVWDKPHRIDNVFGSANGTKTIDVVIKEFDELEGKNLSERRNGEDQQNSSTSTEDSEDESDDEDDIMVTIGASANIGTSNSKPDVHAKSHKENQGEEAEEDGDQNVDSFNPYWRDKLRPNYFICVRITDPAIVDNIGEVHDHLLKQEPLLGECCIPGSSLHVTLCTLGLDTADQLLHCMSVLNKMKDELKSVLPQSPLRLHGVSNFYNRVLYAKVLYKDDFMEFCNELKFNLLEAGIEIRDGYEFVPHMTILKTTRPVSRLRGTKNINSSLYQAVLEKRFGEQKVDSIYLCSMGNDRREDGFYMTPLELQF